MNTPLVTEYVRKKLALAKLEERVEIMTAELAKMEQTLIDDFAESGTQSVRLTSGTAYLSGTLWAKPKPGVERETVANALRASGLGHMIKEDFNILSLSAWARQNEEAGGDVPEALAEVCNIKKEWKVKVRAAGDGK